MQSVHPLRVAAKALLLFVAFNLAYAAIEPPVGQLSVYNWLVKGRTRFPTAVGSRSYNVSLDDLDAVFAEHVISAGRKPAGEYRVLVLGDSQTWGWTVRADETVAARLNDLGLEACGRQAQFYDLAYPSPSVLRDFVILHRALEYQPDFVVWMVTLESFTLQQWTDGWSPFMLINDPQQARELVREYGLERYEGLIGATPTLYRRTVAGQRSELSRLALAQMYGALWDATGIDSVVKYQTLDLEVPAGEKYLDFKPPKLPDSEMTYDVLRAAHKMVGDVGVLVVNQPIFMPPSKNTEIRYNVLYPRWAYDQYREQLPGLTAQEGWSYADMYGAVPYTQFTNHDFHMTAAGVRELAKAMAPEILQNVACR